MAALEARLIFALSLVLDGGTLQNASTGALTTTDRLFTLTQNGGGLDASARMRLASG